MMLAVTSPVSALFDRLADRYDQVVPFFAEFAARLLDVVAPVPGTRLLDVGSGWGAIASAAAARGCVVTAVDAAPRMVSLLRDAHPEMDVRLMDAHRLDLPGSSYDLATGGFVIHLVDDRARVLGELRRVLRPGASVALTTPGPCEDRGRWDAWDALCTEFAGAPEQGPGSDREVAPYLRAAGFADVMCDPIMNPWDIAALVPVLRGAGGVITDWRGASPYPAESTVAAATPELHAQVIASLKV